MRVERFQPGVLTLSIAAETRYGNIACTVFRRAERLDSDASLQVRSRRGGKLYLTGKFHITLKTGLIRSDTVSIRDRYARWFLYRWNPNSNAK